MSIEDNEIPHRWRAFLTRDNASIEAPRPRDDAVVLVVVKVRKRSELSQDAGSLAARRALVARKPKVGIAEAPDRLAATRGHVGHSSLLVFGAVRGASVSLSGIESFG